MKDDEVAINSLIRSLIDSGKEYVVSMLNSLSALSGAKSLAKGSYPGWKPEPSSPVMTLVRETYETLFNKTPNIMVIHAGLECGLFKKPYPDMDMVSIGNHHRPHCRMSRLKSKRELYWKLLTAL